MTAPDITAAAIAQLFHEAYEHLAPSFGYQTRRESAVPWDQVPEQNRALMTAVAAEVVPVLLDSHEKQVREEIAGELRARVADITEMTGPRAARRRAFHAAANSVAPEPSLEEVAVAFARGDYAACYLDDAGQPIARGSRPAADGEASDGV